MNAKLVEQSRNANFSLSQQPGKQKFYNVTSAAQAFTPDKLKQKDSVASDMQNMRIANFKMGFDKKTDYNTTSNFNNQHMNESPGNASKDRSKQLQEQRDRVRKNRQPNYDFGRDLVDYRSIAKNNFQAHDLSQCKQAQLDRAKNSSDVRKSHFLFGTDQNNQSMVPIMSNAVPNTIRSQQQPFKHAISSMTTRNDAQKTNIQISHQGVAAGPIGTNRFTSTYGSQNTLKQQPKSFAYQLLQRQSANDVLTQGSTPYADGANSNARELTPAKN